MIHKLLKPSQNRLIERLCRIFAKLLRKPKSAHVIETSNESVVLPLGRRDSYSNDDSYLICLTNSIDKSAFMLKAKVKSGTYAGELLANLYDELFNRSPELKNDYVDYYAIEYGTFDEYVRKRFLFAPDIIREISTRFTRSRQIIYFQPSYYFLKEDYGLEFMKKLFEPEENL